MTHILDLSPELLSNILSFLPPGDIVRFGQTCRSANTFIDPLNQILWHLAFLQVFDEPADAWSVFPPSYEKPTKSWDWHAELRNRLAALQAIKSTDPVQDPEAALTHLNAILSIVDTAKFASTVADAAAGKVAHEDDDLSLNLKQLAMSDKFKIGLDKLIHDTKVKNPVQHSMYPRPVTRSMAWAIDEANRPEAACRLHVLHGLTVRERYDKKARGAARRKIYNWTCVNAKTDYGPFEDDGSGAVNWSLLAGSCSIITRVFEICVWNRIECPQGLQYSIPYRTITDPTIPEDWARVSGQWLGTYAFLDYEDLFTYNTTEQGALRTHLDDDDAEGHGDLMHLNLKLDNSVKDDPKLRTNIPICHDVPPLYFTGTSRAEDWIQRPMAQVKGLVALLPGGREVRWKFIITYDNRDMWQLEGVQPGGIRSGGVYGLWSQVTHEMGGPVGPFCYFPKELCKRALHPFDEL